MKFSNAFLLLSPHVRKNDKRQKNSEMLCICKKTVDMKLFNSIFYYWRVTTVNKFVQLMYLNWLKSVSTRSNIFPYSPSSGMMVALFVNIGERKKRRPLQRGSWNEFIATKPLQQIHCKKPNAKRLGLLSFLCYWHIRGINTIFNNCFLICKENIAFSHRTDLASSVGI